MCVFVSAGVAAMLWRSLLLVACLALVAEAKVRADAHLPALFPKGKSPGEGRHLLHIYRKFLRLLYITGDVRQNAVWLNPREHRVFLSQCLSVMVAVRTICIEISPWILFIY
jgi:hypothetical protein